MENKTPGLTKLTVWLMRLGIKIINARAYQRQSNNMHSEL